MTKAMMPGANLPRVVIDSVSADLMVPMAALLEDPNQIHLDAEFVRALGLGSQVINQGPTNCGYAMNMILDAFPTRRLSWFKASFLANVFAGDRLEISGTVRESPDPSVISCDYLVTNQHQVDVLAGSARLVERTATQTE